MGEETKGENKTKSDMKRNDNKGNDIINDPEISITLSICVTGICLKTDMYGGYIWLQLWGKNKRLVMAVEKAVNLSQILSDEYLKIAKHLEKLDELSSDKFHVTNIVKVFSAHFLSTDATTLREDTNIVENEYIRSLLIHAGFISSIGYDNMIKNVFSERLKTFIEQTIEVNINQDWINCLEELLSDKHQTYVAAIARLGKPELFKNIEDEYTMTIANNSFNNTSVITAHTVVLILSNNVESYLNKQNNIYVTKYINKIVYINKMNDVLDMSTTSTIVTSTLNENSVQSKSPKPGELKDDPKEQKYPKPEIKDQNKDDRSGQIKRAILPAVDKMLALYFDDHNNLIAINHTISELTTPLIEIVEANTSTHQTFTRPDANTLHLSCYQSKEMWLRKKYVRKLSYFSAQTQIVLNNMATINLHATTLLVSKQQNNLINNQLICISQLHNKQLIKIIFNTNLCPNDPRETKYEMDKTEMTIKYKGQASTMVKQTRTLNGFVDKTNISNYELMMSTLLASAETERDIEIAKMMNASADKTEEGKIQQLRERAQQETERSTQAHETKQYIANKPWYYSVKEQINTLVKKAMENLYILIILIAIIIRLYMGKTGIKDNEAQFKQHQGLLTKFSSMTLLQVKLIRSMWRKFATVIKKNQTNISV